MIIDIHAHCFDDDIAKKAVPILAKKANITAYTDGTISNLKRSMKDSGIDISVIQSIATKAKQTPVINSWIATIKDSNIIPFGTIHPEYKEWKEEIRKLVSIGIKGIKFHPDYQNFYVDDPNLFKIYEEIFNNNLIILFHAGIDIGLPKPCHCTPKRLRNVINIFRGATIIAAHMGGYDCWDDVEKYLLGEEVYFDTSYTSHILKPSLMTKYIKEHGTNKILFGTDSPWGNQSEEVEFIQSLSLTEEEKFDILGGNAKKLLRL